MLVVFQFPLCDARPFDGNPDLRIPVPDWPDPETDIRPQFVHHFGRAVERRRSADPAWPDEVKFCLARRALRFVELERHHLGLPGALMKPRGAFRRLFCDQEGSLVRVETGIAHHRRAPRLRGLDAHRVLAIAKDCCDLPTIVPQAPAAGTARKILLQAPALARLYARSTLPRSAPALAARAEELVEGGRPLLLIELKPSEADLAVIPDGFSRVPIAGYHKSSLAFGRLGTHAGVVGTWILLQGKADPVEHRSLRLCLLRLHAEQETLDLLLKQIQRKRLLNPPSPEMAGKLNNYFNRKTRLINRAEWGGVNQSAILAALDAAEQVTPQATRRNLIERYEGARRQVWQKIEDYQVRRAAVRVVPVVNVGPGGTYVEKNVTINQSGTGNIANVAEYMSQVSNQVTNNLGNSAAGEDVKALIKQLAEQIAAISTKIDPKQTQQMGKDLKALTEEMAQAEPRRAWYELSLKGIKDAAAAVGEIALPVVETVKKLLPLLLP